MKEIKIQKYLIKQNNKIKTTKAIKCKKVK